MKMARKQVVLIIVEGPSDQTALGFAFNNYLASDYVHIEVMHRDITTEKGATSSNIITKINDIINIYASNYHIRKTDIRQIVHLTDIDGAFIKDDKINHDEQAIDPIYETTGIKTNNVEGIKNRNIQKKSVLVKLSQTQQIGSIPYKLFYMSSNLDHVFYNKPNSTKSEKEIDSHNFAKKYKTDFGKFIIFLSDSTISYQGNYRDSWKYIIQEEEEILRLTNLNLFFAKTEKNQGS